MIVAEQLKRPFYVLSAVSSGVKDVREVIQKAESQRFFNTPNPILFIDEIHRFSKAQQDSLLAAVEGNRYPDRGDDRESFVRGDLAFIVPLSGICPEISGESRSGRLDRPCGYDRFLSERKKYRR